MLKRLFTLFIRSQDWFIGHQLFDNDATITHHFAFHDNPKAFKYPHLDAGVLLSRPVLRRYTHITPFFPFFFSSSSSSSSMARKNAIHHLPSSVLVLIAHITLLLLLLLLLLLFPFCLLRELGLLLLLLLLLRVCAKIGEQQLPRDFAIDVQHELALYLYSDNIKVNLTHSPAFCLAAADGCATWIQPFQSCVSRKLNYDPLSVLFCCPCLSIES